jgi:hypothetical protein
MCPNELYSTVRVVKHLSFMFFIKYGLEQGDALSSFLFNCAAEYTIRRFKVKKNGLKLNGTIQLLV